MPEWVQRKMGIGFKGRERDRDRSSSAAPYKPSKALGDRPAPPAARQARDKFSSSSAGPASTKPSRRTPANHTRLWLGVGEEMGVGPGDVVGAILGETGLPSGTVGIVDVRERHVFVDVATEHSAVILSKLRQTRIKGQPVKAKLA